MATIHLTTSIELGLFQVRVKPEDRMVIIEIGKPCVHDAVEIWPATANTIRELAEKLAEAAKQLED